MSNDSKYGWTFYAYSGDGYSGVLWDNSADYYTGQTLYTSYGYYQITWEDQYGYDVSTVYGAGYNEGTVYVTDYDDVTTGTYNLYTWSEWTYGTEVSASGTSGLGSEYDWAWNGTSWDDFGYGGAYQVNSFVEAADSKYGWTFYAYSGDGYSGVLWDDSADYYTGQTLYTSYGYYQITWEDQYGYDVSTVYGAGYNEGTVYVTDYDDVTTGTYNLYTWSEWTYGTEVSASGTSGLGSEYDWAWNGTSWDDFGYGGAYQVNYF